MTAPDHPMRDGQLLDANVHLLDRTIVDADDIPTSVVDDVEIDMEQDGRPVIASLVLGSSIVPRYFKAKPPRHIRFHIPWRDVSSVDTAIHLAVRRTEVDIIWFENWLRDYVIGRIPGGRRAPE